MHAISPLSPDPMQSYGEKRNFKRVPDQSPEKENVRMAPYLGCHPTASPLKKRLRLPEDCPPNTTFYATAQCVGSVFRELQAGCFLTPSSELPPLAGPTATTFGYFDFNNPHTLNAPSVNCASLQALEELDLPGELAASPTDLVDNLPQFHRPPTPVYEDDELQGILQADEVFDDPARFSLQGLASVLEGLELEELGHCGFKRIDR